MATGGEEPAAHSGCVRPFAAPVSRCLPPELILACNAHESVLRTALEARIGVRGALRSQHQRCDSYSIIERQSADHAAALDAISG